jgi:hypothetical protein
MVDLNNPTTLGVFWHNIWALTRKTTILQIADELASLISDAEAVPVYASLRSIVNSTHTFYPGRLLADTQTYCATSGYTSDDAMILGTRTQRIMRTLVWNLEYVAQGYQRHLQDTREC